MAKSIISGLAEGRRLRRRRSQQGVAIIVVLMMSSIVLIFIGMGMRMASGSMKQSDKQFARQAQATNIARAGLQDAIGWFKRQSTQPVRNNTGANPLPHLCGGQPASDRAFNPVYNADPLVSDTDDTTGNALIKDIRLSGNIYGRYTIKRQPCGASDAHAVHDYTDEKGRGADGEGLIWFVESEGVLYQRNDFTKSGGVFTTGPSASPNRVLQKAAAAVEIQRLKIEPPGNHAVTLSAASGTVNSTVGSRCNIMGDSTVNVYGVYRYNTTVSGTAACSFSPGVPCVAASYGIYGHQSVDTVFGVSKPELKALSDYIYSSVANVPKKLSLAIHYLDGGGTNTFTFNSTKPLVGSGVLFVDGNLTLADGASSAFNGVVYVTGHLNVGNGNSLGGAVLTRSMTCDPGSGLAVLEYNHSVVTNIKQKLGLYRENALTYRITN